MDSADRFTLVGFIALAVVLLAWAVVAVLWAAVLAQKAVENLLG